MKKLLFVAFLAMASNTLLAQWEISALGETGDTIDFSNTIDGVNNGQFLGDGFEPNPASGRLDSDAWKLNGMSQGNLDFGDTDTTANSDFARGEDDGGVSSGGVYAFAVATGDTALGFQATGGDWTPGDLWLMVINNSGDTADSFTIAFDLYINNDNGRANSFNFSYSVNDTNSFTAVSAMSDTSIETSQGSVAWVAHPKMMTVNETMMDGDTLFMLWESDDVSGSGSRDEFALDNISVVLHGTPEASTSTGLPLYDIGTISTVDTNGVADSLDVECSIKGVTMGVDLDGNNGYSFTIWDGNGINVYSSSDIGGYQMDEGDSLQLFGTIGQFNGLTQFEVDSIVHLDSNQTIPSPTVVTSLDESTESELIRIENFWVDAISGSNYTLSDGSNNVVMRIDFDTDIPGNVDFAIGDTICYVIGIGGQFDNSSPYTEGYQFFPQRAVDVDNSCGSIPPPPVNYYPIPDINNVDVNGEPDSIGVYCWTSGTVIGVDLDGNAGLSFTLWDDEGINIFNFNDVSNYVVTEGDSLLVRGAIDFYNGLTELFVDSIEIISTGNAIPEPKLVDAPSEETESDYITIRNVTVIDPNDWPTSFSSNVELLTCSGDTIVMRIDTDTDVEENIPNPPTGFFHITGTGGQFDSSNPYTEGYQIFPMTHTDIDSNVAPNTGLSLLINEVMTDNATSETDAAGDHDDWVEIKNTGTGSSSLAGLYMTNDASTPNQYMVPSSSSESIPAGAYTLVWCDNEPSEGDLHTNFTLDNTGDYFGIYQEDGCDYLLVDELTVPALGTDESYGYYPEGTDTLVVFPSNSTTPGMVNMLDTTTGIGSFDEANMLTLYPNPASVNQTIRFNQNVSFTIYDLLGNAIRQEQNAVEISTANLAAGTYILTTDTGEVLRFVVQ